MSLLALLAIALHVFTVEGHVHVSAFAAHGAAAHGDDAGATVAQQALSNPTSQAPCIFCQAMVSSGPGLVPLAPLLVLFGAAALIAALFGRRQVSLQRLNTWRSRAPPLSA